MNDHVTTLAALYQGEKTDSAYVFNTAMAMMGIGMFYLAAIVSCSDRFGSAPLTWWIVLLLPFPLWLIAAFHSLMILNAMSHGVSVRIIENALFRTSGLSADRDLVGSAAGDKIMDVTQSCFAHAFTTYVVYIGVAALVVVFTGYALYGASRHLPPWAIAVAIFGYLFLLTVVGNSWVQGLRVIADGNRRSQKVGPESTHVANAMGQRDPNVQAVE
jgi:hypothetical protein